MQTEEHDSQQSVPGQGNDPQTSTSGSAPISLDDATIEGFLNHPKVKEVIESTAERKAKSLKDRRIAGLEKDVEDILSQISLTPEQRAQVDAISQKNVIAKLQEAVFNQQGNSSPSPAKGQGSDGPDFIGTFQKAGYDVNSLSMEDLSFAETFQGNSTQLANALLKRRLERGAQNAPVSAGGVMPTMGGVPVAVSGSEQALMADYRSELAKIRPGSVDEIAKLKKTYRDKGLKNLY